MADAAFEEGERTGPDRTCGRHPRPHRRQFSPLAITIAVAPIHWQPVLL